MTREEKIIEIEVLTNTIVVNKEMLADLNRVGRLRDEVELKLFKTIRDSSHNIIIECQKSIIELLK